MSQLSSSEINIALLSLGGLVLLLGLLSGFLKERLFLSDPIVALLLGVLLGPSVLILD
jgi:NhaP-type Na+/H+ or K+/H+ antiporter